ncbi:hypothetical protein IE982_00420 [Enterobacter hormaechei]|nr:hypothetical protein [Enterobacter hormaechei]
MANMFALILGHRYPGDRSVVVPRISLSSPQNAVNVRLPRRQPRAMRWTRKP